MSRRKYSEVIIHGMRTFKYDKIKLDTVETINTCYDFIIPKINKEIYEVNKVDKICKWKNENCQTKLKVIELPAPIKRLEGLFNRKFKEN